MRSRRTRLGILAAAAALLLAGGNALAAPQIGGVAQRDYRGATGTPVGATSEYLYFDNDIFAGETVATPGSGSTVLRFLDRTKLRVGADSTVVLDRFVYDPDAHTGAAAIKFTKGIFRYVSGDITNKNSVKLTTPTASLTIRGTDFKVYVAGDGSTIIQVDEGAVDISPCGGGKTVRAKPGKAFKVSATCDGVELVGLSSVPHDVAVDGGLGGGGNAHPGHPAAAVSRGGGGEGGGGCGCGQ